MSFTFTISHQLTCPPLSRLRSQLGMSSLLSDPFLSSLRVVALTILVSIIASYGYTGKSSCVACIIISIERGSLEFNSLLPVVS